VANIQELSLGFSLKSLLEQYTKPFLTGPLYHDFYSGKGYVECDIDIHRYCYWARKVAFDVIQWLPEAIIELAFVVEAQGDEEMPEQVIGSVRLNKLHPDDDAMDASEWLASALHQTTGKESGDASTEQAANKPPLSGQTAFSKRRSSSDMVHTTNDVTREGLHQRRQSHSAL
jgi:hypothetical protein